VVLSSGKLSWVFVLGVEEVKQLVEGSYLVFSRIILLKVRLEGFCSVSTNIGNCVAKFSCFYRK